MDPNGDSLILSRSERRPSKHPPGELPCRAERRPLPAQGALARHEGVDYPVGRSVVDQFTMSKDH